MRYKQIVSEVRYEDIYPKAFVTFREKWIQVPLEERQDLFVQFSNHQNDVLIKTANTSPNHSDPAAVYAYPLDYVLTHPADIWYGQKAKYLRLLKSKSVRVLDLQKPLSENEAIELLLKIPMKPPQYHWGNFPKTPDEFMKLAIKRFKYNTANRYTKALWSVVQYRLQYNQPAQAFTAVEQTERLLGMGFDTVKDYAADEFTAVINHREPEQVLFLTRSAFEVVELVTLRPNLDVNNVKSITHYWSSDSLRKLAGMIAYDVLQDNLENSELSELGSGKYFYTKRGNKIQLRTDFRKMARSTIKPHRGADIDTKEDIIVELDTDKGYIKKTYPSSMTFSEIVTSLKKELLPNSIIFEPQSLLKNHPDIEKKFNELKTLVSNYSLNIPDTISLSTKVLLSNIYEIIYVNLQVAERKDKKINVSTTLETIKEKFPELNGYYYNLFIKLLTKLKKEKSYTSLL